MLLPSSQLREKSLFVPLSGEAGAESEEQSTLDWAFEKPSAIALLGWQAWSGVRHAFVKY